MECLKCHLHLFQLSLPLFQETGCQLFYHTKSSMECLKCHLHLFLFVASATPKNRLSALLSHKKFYGMLKVPSSPVSICRFRYSNKNSLSALLSHKKFYGMLKVPSSPVPVVASAIPRNRLSALLSHKNSSMECLKCHLHLFQLSLPLFQETGCQLFYHTKSSMECLKCHLHLFQLSLPLFQETGCQLFYHTKKVLWNA